MEDLFKSHQFDFVYLCFPLRDSRRQRSILLCVWRKKALWHLWISFVRTGQTLICSVFYLLWQFGFCFSTVLCHLSNRYIHLTVTVWRRELQRGTRPFTTASCIIGLNLLSYSSKRRQRFKQVHFTLLIVFLFCIVSQVESRYSFFLL